MSDDATPSRWPKILLAVVVFLLLSCAGVCCGLPFAGGAAYNAGTVDVSEIDGTWTVERPDGGRGAPAAPVVMALKGRCQPMRNGLRVLFNELWYNAITDGYDTRIWLQGPEGSYDQYALYIWGNHVYLRDEAGAGGYRNRILTCDVTVEQWKTLAGL